MPISNWAWESPQNSQPLVGFLRPFELEQITDHGTDQGLKAGIILVTRGIADTHTPLAAGTVPIRQLTRRLGPEKEREVNR